MKPTSTITVKVQNIRFDVSIDIDDPKEPYMDGVWLCGSVQELSNVLDLNIYNEIEDSALQEIADRQYDSAIEAHMEECTGS
tara:strand:- start:1661 stop:1906 length:246 start_codon:yes stop_codon:yes gene_type:complete